MRRTILLADDSPTIQRLVTNTFAEGNFDIVSVSNGEAAIRKLEDIRPSVVLADIYMPGKNGYEVCAHVRQHPVFNATPVILLVGAFDAFDDAKAQQAGATASITKPFEPHALVELVESVIPGLPPAVEQAATPPAPPAPAPAPVSAPPQQAARAAARVPSSPSVHPPEDVSAADLLGLEELFKDEDSRGKTVAEGLTEADIDRIADRVLRRMTAEAVETIAWEIVPDLTERIVREELKKIK